MEAKNKDQKTYTLRETLKLNIRALKLIYKNWPHLIISGQLVAVWRALPAYVNITFSAQIVEELAGNRDMGRLTLLILMTLGTTALLDLISHFLTRYKSIATYNFYHKARKILWGKLMDMDYCIIDNPKVHEDLNTIWQFQNSGGWGIVNVAGRFESMTQSAVSLFVGIALVVSLFTRKVPASAGSLTVLNSPLFLVGMAAVLLFLTWLSPHLGTKANSYYAKHAGDHSQGNRLFGFYGWLGYRQDTAADMRIYRQDIICDKYNFNKEDTFLSKGLFAKLGRGPVGGYFAASAAVPYIFTGIVYVFVCLKAWAGAFGIGMVTQYIRIISRFSDNIASFVWALGYLRNNVPFLVNIFEFLDKPNVMDQGSLPMEKRDDREYEVEFRDVSFQYPGSDQYALRHVNLKFKAGKRLAVVGQNGSGKTTFIKLLCRLYDPTEGEILLNGTDIRKYDYDQYLSIFSVVFQDFNLTDFTLGQNVAGSDDYDPERVKACLEKAGFEDRLKEMPAGADTYISTYIDDKGVNLSGGEKQKVAIARALYKDAPFIILDEPTAALDPVAEAEIYSKFSELVEDKTAIYISHRLSSCRFCDDILVFDQGSVVQQGSHEALEADEAGKYHELWHAQAQYYSKEVVAEA